MLFQFGSSTNSSVIFNYLASLKDVRVGGEGVGDILLLFSCRRVGGFNRGDLLIYGSSRLETSKFSASPPNPFLSYDARVWMFRTEVSSVMDLCDICNVTMYLGLIILRGLRWCFNYLAITLFAKYFTGRGGGPQFFSVYLRRISNFCLFLHVVAYRRVKFRL